VSLSKVLYFLTVNYYSGELVKKLIDSIDSDRSFVYRIAIVNNSTDDLTLRSLNNKSAIVLEAQENIGFARACNLGLNWIYDRNPDAIVWIINPDTYLKENALENLFDFFKSYPGLSIVGTIVYTHTGKIWFAGGRFVPKFGTIETPNLFKSNSAQPYVLCDWISGCSTILNLHHFQTCPQFDPAYFLYYEDVDFCLRYANEGHKIALTNRIAIVHKPSSITNRNIANKLRHSNYSYLLTMEKYTTQSIVWLQLLRLAISSLMILLIAPQAALGKLAGIADYLARSAAAKKNKTINI
jgi:GT2 family glycosyltransferase